MSGCLVFTCVVLTVLKSYSQWKLLESEYLIFLCLQGFHCVGCGPTCAVACLRYKAAS